MPTLSVVIIAKNEIENIARCLRSVQFADEVIVLDSGSTDGTQSLAQSLGAKVIETDWPGFGPQKNRAIEYASCDWVLSLDADEWLSEELQDTILQLVKENHDCSYQILRQSSYCGTWIRFGQWRNDYVLRLFKRGRAKFSNDIVHEKLIAEDPTKKIPQRIQHESFKDMHQVLTTMNSYSSLSAEMKIKQGKTSSLLNAIGHGLWTFMRGYFLQLGFLDGKAGFMLAVTSAEGSYYRYIKLMLASHQESEPRSNVATN